MARKRLNLEYMSNDSVRKASFDERNNGLFEKACELSMLCNVKACVVMYTPSVLQPEILPPSPLAVRRILTEFKGGPLIRCAPKKISHDRFIVERIEKVNAHQRRLRREARRNEMVHLMNRSVWDRSLLPNLSGADLNDLGSVIDKTITAISLRIVELRNWAEQQWAEVLSPQPCNSQQQLRPQPMDARLFSRQLAADPRMAPPRVMEGGFVAGELINFYGNKIMNINNFNKGDWPNSSYH